MNRAVGRFRGDAVLLLKTFLKLVGLYKPMSPAEKAIVQSQNPEDKISFKGDAPIFIPNGKCEQIRQIYKVPRPPFETVTDLVVTPEGAGWKDGALHERYSSSIPGFRMLLSLPPRPVAEVAEGIFVQASFLGSFGDWGAEFLAGLAQLDAIDAPVFLPSRLASRSYVRRDAKRLGFEIVSVDEPLLIRKAKVVRQQKYIRFWRKEEVEQYRRLLKVDLSDPIPGSILYLSRHGDTQAVYDRTYPNAAIEAVVKDHGGMVLRTGDASLEDYLAVAQYAETLIFDHGSAAYNMLYWRPRRIIEFASDQHWMNAFVNFSDAVGVRDYTIIRSDLGSPEDVAAKTAAVLGQPIET